MLFERNIQKTETGHTVLFEFPVTVAPSKGLLKRLKGPLGKWVTIRDVVYRPRRERLELYVSGPVAPEDIATIVESELSRKLRRDREWARVFGNINWRRDVGVDILEGIVFQVDVLLERQALTKTNICSTSTRKARSVAEKFFAARGDTVDEVFGDFDKSFAALKRTCQKALDLPRFKMPVIEPEDMKDFHRRLKTGRLDIFQPWARGHLFTPEKISPSRGGDEWVTLGFQDGEIRDDVVKARWTRIAAKKLLPTQSQIWLEKVLNDIVDWGRPHPWSGATERTIITSKEGYILDGHHRWTRVYLTNWDAKMKVLQVPIDIDTLVDVGRTYGLAIGNTPNR